DAVSLGKSMGGGMPVSAVVGRRELLDVAPAINMYTMAGNPVACAAALAHLDEIERLDLAGQAGRIGGYLLGRLRELRQRHPLIGDVRGLGMMLGLETVRDRSTREPAGREMAKSGYRALDQGPSGPGGPDRWPNGSARRASRWWRCAGWTTPASHGSRPSRWGAWNARPAGASACPRCSTCSWSTTTSRPASTSAARAATCA